MLSLETFHFWTNYLKPLIKLTIRPGNLIFLTLKDISKNLHIEVVDKVVAGRVGYKYKYHEVIPIYIYIYIMNITANKAAANKKAEDPVQTAGKAFPCESVKSEV